jgi:hypothetical protein
MTGASPVAMTGVRCSLRNTAPIAATAATPAADQMT